MTPPIKLPLELLAPAKNAALGKIAIAHGADAVYIGPTDFGARAAVGNSLNDIADLVQYAHGYRAKVYATINTLLFDEQVEPAFDLAWKLYHVGVDALIIQDMALCDMDRLPPMELHASTQTHNYTAERIQFLESVGFDRVIVARECSSAQIRSIHSKTNIPLEAFVHGSLCVSYSGQCYMSETLFRRSANKGVCAQTCRFPYNLLNEKGKVLLQNKHLLSLKDNNQLEQLPNLIEAGVRSFKIEGRLKETDYVKNVVSAYRLALDAYIASHPEYTSSSGAQVRHFFTPNLSASFNRGFTSYFSGRRPASLISALSPKSLGEYVGVVKTVLSYNKLQVTPSAGSPIRLSNGDGLVFFSEDECLGGTRLNSVQDGVLEINDPFELKPGIRIYRNYHHQFQKSLLSEGTAERKIPIRLSLSEDINGDFCITATDDLLHQSTLRIPIEQRGDLSMHPEAAYNRFIQAFSKLGDTPFSLIQEALPQQFIRMVAQSILNAWRRTLVDQLWEVRKEGLRQAKREIEAALLQKREALQLPSKQNYAFITGDFRDNIANAKAEAFYRKLTDQPLGKALEVASTLELVNASSVSIVQEGISAPLMTCKYCLKYELGGCARFPKPLHEEEAHPLVVADFDWTEYMYLHSKAHVLRLSFDCKACEMRIFMEN